MRRKRRGLSAEDKAFLVQKLACFATPGEAAEALKAERGVEVTAQGAEHYDPTKRAGRSLAENLKTLFHETRKAYREQLDNIPIANAAVRLERLERGCRIAMQRGNYVLAASLMEQAAKEKGGSFTNRREFTGKDGGPIQHEDVTLMTDDEIDRELMRLLGGANPASVQAAPEAKQ